MFIAYGKERAAVPTFFELAQRSFALEFIPDSELEIAAPSASSSSDGGGGDGVENRSLNFLLQVTFTIGIVKMVKK